MVVGFFRMTCVFYASQLWFFAWRMFAARVSFHFSAWFSLSVVMFPRLIFFLALLKDMVNWNHLLASTVPRTPSRIGLHVGVYGSQTDRKNKLMFYGGV